MINMNSSKEQLRLWLKSKRMPLSPNEVETISNAVSKRLIEYLNWDSIKSVHCYEEITSLNEISTAEIRKYMDNMSHIRVTLQDKISTPLKVDQKYDLVVIPTLGFDLKGNRLGWGGGFYDQFLADQRQALKIGLCYQIGYLPKGLLAETHDIPLDIVITESKTYSFNSK